MNFQPHFGYTIVSNVVISTYTTMDALEADLVLEVRQRVAETDVFVLYQAVGLDINTSFFLKW